MSLRKIENKGAGHWMLYGGVGDARFGGIFRQPKSSYRRRGYDVIIPAQREWEPFLCSVDSLRRAKVILRRECGA